MFQQQNLGPRYCFGIRKLGALRIGLSRYENPEKRILRYGFPDLDQSVCRALRNYTNQNHIIDYHFCYYLANIDLVLLSRDYNTDWFLGFGQYNCFSWIQGTSRALRMPNTPYQQQGGLDLAVVLDVAQQYDSMSPIFIPITQPHKYSLGLFLYRPFCAFSTHPKVITLRTELY